ncbi:IS66-like element accessory protein TnpA [Microvirga arvi]|uniref:Transposase n=1 Tax=Microvirga mediterraneensis TaxID=2754695 RepID=A0A838BV23_9HYPH|nr:transposase [Microvirga mediterraneensis]MBA1159100.1 transposase [Microvirga mediterraneensis]MBA1159258.1 transposase [Microvirga mediterraneensis]
MDIIRDREPVSRLDVVDTGRRRRFSDEAKLAIVAESYRGPKQVSATARRHGITRFQLNSWRKAHREGRLGAGSWDGFVPALVVPDARAPLEPSPTAPVPYPPSGLGRMDVVTANGRHVIVDRDVDVDALLRIIRGLEALR